MDLRKRILDSDDLPRVKVACPEWGCDIWVRTVGGTERDQFEEASLVKRGKTRETSMRNIRARMVVLTACDEAGRPVFHPADVDNVGSKSARVLDRLYDAACRLNGWSDADVEEMVKNSEIAPTGNSASSLPVISE